MRLLSTLLALVLFATGCVTARPAADAAATLTGTVSYLPRIALPPDAVVTVRLLDVSLADAPSVTLAEAVIPTDGRQVPISFALAYRADEIQPRHRYAVRAEIRGADGGLLWTTDTIHPVLTNGAPTDGVEVRVVQVPASSAEADGLVGPTWRLVEVDGDRPAGAEATVSFDADGRVFGTSGCNRFTGPYEFGADGALTLGALASTRMACAPPAMALERRVLDVLSTLTGADVAGIRLTLRGADGTLVFEREDLGMPPQRTGEDYTFVCDGFDFRIRTGPGEIALWLPERFDGREGGTYRVLGQVRAASGAKYQDGPVTVWTKGDEALLEVDGETFTGCRLQTP